MDAKQSPRPCCIECQKDELGQPPRLQRREVLFRRVQQPEGLIEVDDNVQIARVSGQCIPDDGVSFRDAEEVQRMVFVC